MLSPEIITSRTIGNVMSSPKSLRSTGGISRWDARGFGREGEIVGGNDYNFGTRRVLLTIAAAQAKKIALAICMSPLPPALPQRVAVPNGSPFPPSIAPSQTKYAIPATIVKLVGIGSPSKYWDFPVASLGTSATVALNRARRARPEQMKPVRITVSSNVRKPITKAKNAGATPNEI